MLMPQSEPMLSVEDADAACRICGSALFVIGSSYSIWLAMVDGGTVAGWLFLNRIPCSLWVFGSLVRCVPPCRDLQRTGVLRVDTVLQIFGYGIGYSGGGLIAWQFGSLNASQHAGFTPINWAKAFFVFGSLCLFAIPLIHAERTPELDLCNTHEGQRVLAKLLSGIALCLAAACSGFSSSATLTVFGNLCWLVGSSLTLIEPCTYFCGFQSQSYERDAQPAVCKSRVRVQTASKQRTASSEHEHMLARQRPSLKVPRKASPTLLSEASCAQKLPEAALALVGEWRLVRSRNYSAFLEEAQGLPWMLKSVAERIHPVPKFFIGDNGILYCDTVCIGAKTVHEVIVQGRSSFHEPSECAPRCTNRADVWLHGLGNSVSRALAHRLSCVAVQIWGTITMWIPAGRAIRSYQRERSSVSITSNDQQAVHGQQYSGVGLTNRLDTW